MTKGITTFIDTLHTTFNKSENDVVRFASVPGAEAKRVRAFSFLLYRHEAFSGQLYDKIPVILKILHSQDLKL